MNTLDAITQRRSIKHYDPNHVMSEEEERALFEKVILSPTSFNIQNWRFVAVRDQELRKQIRAAAWDQAQVTEASLLVVLTADLKAWNKNPERYWKDAPEGPRSMLVPMITQFYEGRDQMQRDEAIRSTGIAGQTLMLAAKAMGYDTCPMVGFDPVKVAELINLPEDHIVSYMIAVGKEAKPAWARPGQLPLEDVVIRDKF